MKKEKNIMKKWCLIDRVLKRGLEVLYVFDSKEEAIKEAEWLWEHLCESDQNDRDAFIAGVCNVEMNEDGDWDYVEGDYDVYECEKDFVEALTWK